MTHAGGALAGASETEDGASSALAPPSPELASSADATVEVVASSPAPDDEVVSFPLPDDDVPLTFDPELPELDVDPELELECPADVPVSVPVFDALAPLPQPPEPATTAATRPMAAPISG